MMNKNGHSVVDDKTPAMGSMLVSKQKNIHTKKEGIEKIGSVRKMVTKCYLVHNNTKKKVEIDKYPFTIGRLSKDDLKIPNNQVSRSHAIIDKKNGTLFIVNNSSLNGLRVNDHVVERILLLDGDIITIASESFTIKVEEVMQENSGNNKHKTTDEIIVDKKDSKVAHIERLLSTQTPPVIESLSENVNEAVLIKKENNKKQKPILKLAIFSLAGIIVAASGLYGYQYYKTTMQESRVFVVTDDVATPATKQETKNNKASIEPKLASGVIPQDEPKVEKINKIRDPKKGGGNQKSLNKVKITKKKVVNKKAISKVVKKTSLKNKVLYAYKSSKVEIQNAVNLYHAGRYDESIQLLANIKENKRHQSEFRVQASDMKLKISELFDLYKKGTHAYDANNKDEAFILWVKLLNQHKVYFPKNEGFYTNEIKELVASEYENRGNNAYVKEKWSNAYANWRNSLAMRPKSSVQKSIKMMDAEIKELYRTGYRYETVNIIRALDYWKLLIKKAPADHEYYIKANAKIKWYENGQ